MPSKVELTRQFLKKLPRRKSVTERDICDVVGTSHQHAFFIMSNLKNELKLSTRLEHQVRDNGKMYQVRVYFKP